MSDKNFDNQIQTAEERLSAAKDSVQEGAKKAKTGVAKIAKAIKKTLIVLMLCVVGATIFCAGMYVSSLLNKDIVSNQIEITNVHVKEKLEAIGQLSTYAYEYTDIKEEKNARRLFDTVIPGTTNEVQIIYSGVIKVGYKVGSIECDVHNVSKKIIVKLPEVQIFDHYIKFDDLQIREENNILNPIATETVMQYFQQIKEEELKIAESKGIYDLAEDQLKVLIEALLSDFSDYEVIFKD